MVLKAAGHDLEPIGTMQWVAGSQEAEGVKLADF